MQWGTKQAVQQRWVQKTIERQFKHKVKEVLGGLGMPEMEYLAKTDTSILDVLRRAGLDVKPTPESKVNHALRYLASLPQEKLLEMIREAAPQHAEVLTRYPRYQENIVKSLRSLILPD